jgi:hypothetical protein
VPVVVPLDAGVGGTAVGTGVGGTGVLVGMEVGGGVATTVEPVVGIAVAVEPMAGVVVTPAGVVPAGWGTKDQSEVGELTGVVDAVDVVNIVACGFVCSVLVGAGCNMKILMTIPIKITTDTLPIIIVRFIRVPSASTELYDLCRIKNLQGETLSIFKTEYQPVRSHFPACLLIVGRIVPILVIMEARLISLITTCSPCAFFAT